MSDLSPSKVEARFIDESRHHIKVLDKG